MRFLSCLAIVLFVHFALACAPASDGPPEPVPAVQGPEGAPGPSGPPGPAGSPRAKDGSRLKAQVTRYCAPDGYEFVTVSTVDSLRGNEACDATGTTASDGVVRCLPTARDAAPHLGQYLDDLCAVPLGVALLGSTTGRYVTTLDTAEDGSVRTTVHAGSALATPASVYAKGADGSCAAVASLPSPYRYFVAGAEVHPIFFVQIVSSHPGAP